jgi:hypothetical protein
MREERCHSETNAGRSRARAADEATDPRFQNSCSVRWLASALYPAAARQSVVGASSDECGFLPATDSFFSLLLVRIEEFVHQHYRCATRAYTSSDIKGNLPDELHALATLSKLTLIQ